jgi:iron(III) transport system substrate-binding protein
MTTSEQATRRPRAIGALLVALLLAACAPARPAAQPAPAAPAASSAPPAAVAQATDRQAPAQASVPAWQAEWEQVLAAAREEGKVVVAGPYGPRAHDAAREFQKKYPEITLEYTGVTARDIYARILTERRAEQYLWDLFIGGSTSGFALRNEGTFDPIRPALILPEVVDSSKWLGGFEDGFMDKEAQYVYAFSAFVNTLVLVNRQAIPESELSSVDQLLDPKWRGRMSFNDPRENGAGSNGASVWLALKGEDWLRQLYQQDVTITRDLRQQVEWVVRNRYPITLGPSAEPINEFRRQGFDAELSWLAPQSEQATKAEPAFNNAMLVNRAPHPNAAKVFLNWLLSQEGQAIWVARTEINSRRLDVPGPPETAPKPGVQYVNPAREDHAPHVEKAKDLAKEVIR